MELAATGPVGLRTNLADSPMTMGIQDGRVSSSIVSLECCGPKLPHGGFKSMLRESVFDAGELANVSYLQARVYGKPFALLPRPISGRLQHHCIGYNIEHGPLAPKDIEGRQVGARTYAQTTGLWVRGILQREYGVNLDRVTWLTADGSHLRENQDPPNCRWISADKKIDQMTLDGKIAAAILGVDMPQDPWVRLLVPDAQSSGSALILTQGANGARGRINAWEEPPESALGKRRRDYICGRCC
jgi:4,5-dihydroxyphthalate decarboxylase